MQDVNGIEEPYRIHRPAGSAIAGCHYFKYRAPAKSFKRFDRGIFLAPLFLTRDLRRIERFEVLERRNPLFEGVTTGVIVRNDHFYMANIQDDKKTGFEPIAILKLHLN